ncbi:MAG: Gfo/Idh/MocA family oxidoreductase [Bryobacteraceae bacterium]|nr:Gfo/Idh/MocA family oxidoreductase [Bryobacteraceae bacterium]
MRIGVVGLGFMGLTHLKAYKNIPGVEIAAVASDDPKALSGDLSGIQGNLGTGGEKFDFGSARKFNESMDCVRAEGIDAVDLCLPTHLHAPVAIEALKHGKHVLVEKPMALDGVQTREMIEAAKASGKVLMSAQVLRFFPAYMALIDAVESGKLGRVHHATFRRRCAAPGWSAWLTNKTLSGGGVFDLLIHDIDMMLVCFGKPDAVMAWGEENLERGIDVITAQFLYPGLGSVTVTGGWHHPKAYPFSMEYTVVGEHGVMDYSSEGRPPKWYGNDGSAEERVLSEKDGYEAEIEYFVECCRTGQAPARCTPESSAAAVELARIAAAAREKKGEPVPCRL